MRTANKLGLLTVGAALFVAACEEAPTRPSGDGPDVATAVLADNAAGANGAADFEALELCKVWVDDTGAPATPFAATFQITATDPDVSGDGTPDVLQQTVTIDGTESPTPGCKIVLLFDGSTAFSEPAHDISIVESAPPTDWAVTDITSTVVVRSTGTTGQVNAQSDVPNRTWTADYADNRHGILVTFENTFTPPPPPGGGEGCTPGFWKNRGLRLGWPAPYAPGDSYDAVFGVTSSFGGTLLDAVRRGGGGEIALGRHAVAALLNAASGNVDYDLSVAEVIALVQDAYAGGDFEGAKDELEPFNEQNAPGFCD